MDDAPNMPTIPRRRRFLLAGAYTLWVFAGFYLAVGLLIALTVGVNFLGIPLTNANEALMQTILTALVYTVATVIILGFPRALKKLRATKEELGLQRLPNWRDIAVVPVAYIVYFVLYVVLFGAVVSLVPGFNADQEQEIGYDGISKGYEFILAFVALVIVAPIAEELFMRGYLYGKLRRLVPTFLAMVVTASLFGLLHGQWNVAVDTFALSLVMTALREYTGTIYGGILIHMAKNGLAFYVLFIDPNFLSRLGGA